MVREDAESPISATDLLNGLGQAIIITDASGRILTVNQTFTKITGYESHEVLGKNPRLLQSGHHSQEFYRRMWRTLKNSGRWAGEVTNRKKNGELYCERLTITAVKDHLGRTTRYVGAFTDVSRQKRAEAAARQMAFFDNLTGLPNRALFLDRLKHAIADACRHKKLFAVLFLDLDRIKVVNDTLGHAAGDQLLREMANRFKKALREADTVARLGGDEFMMLVPLERHRAEALSVAKKLIESVRPVVQIEGHDIYSTASLGIAIYPHDGTQPDILMRNADAAMYRAKRAGRNTYRLFSPIMANEMRNELAMGTSFRQGLAREEFVVHYQPQIDLKTGRISGLEALVRWQHPKLGLLSPTSFVPWAEESGLIVPLGEVVLRNAVRQMSAWDSAGLPRLPLAVNLSARQMSDPDTEAMIRDALRESGFPSERLWIEITESCLVQSSPLEIKLIEKLRAIGVAFAIDDFGTGYSSFNYLKRFPVSELKIDRSFIPNVTVNSTDLEIVRAMIAMGHALHMSVLAEGVETMEQNSLLAEMNCDRTQGFLVSRPLPPSELAAVLA